MDVLFVRVGTRPRHERSPEHCPPGTSGARRRNLRSLGRSGCESGATLILLAALASSAYFVLQRRLIPIYGPLASTAYTLLAGALLLSPWLPGAMSALAAPSASAGTLGAVLVLGVFPAALGYATWTIALGHFGAARASNFLYLVPAIAIALSIFLTGEHPALTTIAGGLMAIAGVAFVAWRGRA